MTKTLEMVFRNSSGKEVTISLPNPKDNLTLAQVQPVMEDIITKNIFATTSGTLIQIVESRIHVNESTKLE